MTIAINEMELEVPLIVYTYQFNNALGDAEVDCNSFYTVQLKFSQATADALCNGGPLNIQTFNFKDRMATAKAWMNIALNNGTFNPSDYADL
jgi:hypothetical protein